MDRICQRDAANRENARTALDAQYAEDSAERAEAEIAYRETHQRYLEGNATALLHAVGNDQ